MAQAQGKPILFEAFFIVSENLELKGQSTLMGRMNPVTVVVSISGLPPIQSPHCPTPFLQAFSLYRELASTINHDWTPESCLRKTALAASNGIAASLIGISTDCHVNIYVNSLPHMLFIWNNEIVEYIAQRGVTPEEFDEVVLSSHEVRTSHSSGRPIAFGPTLTGKYLACVFEYIDADQVIPVTVLARRKM